jgi:hypothetical protein
VKPGEVVSFRKGTAALGLRVPWTRGVDGREAQSWLIYDGNSFGAVRLAIEHVAPGAKPLFNGASAGAAMWIRVGSGLKTDEDFLNWRQSFAGGKVDVSATLDGISVKAAGVDGPVSVSARAPWSAPDALEPVPVRCALEMNGEDMGARIFSTTK